MGIHLYNTLTRQMEPLVTREPGKVSMYICGVTPYDYPHIGNARAYVAFDIIKRYLEYNGFQVMHVQNFTDIDDKIINRAKEQDVPWNTIPERFIPIYFEEMEALNIERASVYPKATDNIPEIISLVESLIERGFAYEANGDVYFEVRKFEPYGELSNRNINEMESGARVEVSGIKRDPLDFALWKASKPGEPSWASPWGPGRPGWHIECSAMSLKYLGPAFDIHGGGQDLIFPHHENEIAQSEAATGMQMLAHYWVHNGFVTINKEKMSKSLGNFFTVREVLEKYAPEVVRYFLTSAHYRSPLDFSDQALDQAKGAYERLRLGVFSMERVITGGALGTEERLEQTAALRELLHTAEADFRQAMDDDFNTPQAIAVLFNLVGEANRLTGDSTFVPDQATLELLSDARAKTLALAAVLGIKLTARAEADTLAPQLMELFIELRATARKEKNFAMADTIRNRLKEIGIILEDTPQGTVWRKE
ncbi:MAG: cysteine--tRNA ligase [Armatimonadota bacterium]